MFERKLLRGKEVPFHKLKLVKSYEDIKESKSMHDSSRKNNTNTILLIDMWIKLVLPLSNNNN